MRIAICFSGQPRSFKKAYPYYKKNLFDKHPGKVDVFFHTWREDTKDLIMSDLIHTYKPKRHLFTSYLEDSDKFNQRFINTPNPARHPPSATVNAFYSIFMSNLLRVQEEQTFGGYDWVVRTRFDYALNAEIPFSKLEPNKIYVPNCRKTPNRDFCNDQFAFGSAHVMTAYSSTYLWLNQFYANDIQMIGEDMLAANLKMYNLVGENLMYVDMKNPFPPGPYNGTPHSLIRDDYEKWQTNS